MAPAPEPAEVEPWRGGTWQELIQGADEVTGADLEHGNTLVGVPMCIIRATYRQGDYVSPLTKSPGWYVSLETVIAPENEITKGIRRNRIPEDNQEYALDMAGERLVFNEGGTGVYRQITAYLEAKGLIRIGADLPDDGHYGESRFDVSPAEWEVPDGGVRYGIDGLPVLDFNLRLMCPRGLRVSEYENEYTKAGVTRYIG